MIKVKMHSIVLRKTEFIGKSPSLEVKLTGACQGDRIAIE
jgi:hypothetical protein